eukprot:gene10170-biopygen5204
MAKSIVRILNVPLPAPKPTHDSELQRRVRAAAAASVQAARADADDPCVVMAGPPRPPPLGQNHKPPFPQRSPLPQQPNPEGCKITCPQLADKLSSNETTN